MKNYLLYLLLFAAPFLRAQNTMPQVFTVSKDSVSYKELPEKYWQYIDSERDSIGYDKILLPQYDKLFKKYAHKSFNINVSNKKNIWIRYRLKNADAKPLKLAIRCSADSYFYIKNGDNLHTYRNGYKVPWSKRQGIKKLFCIVYDIPANTEVTFYSLNMKAGYAGGLYPTIYNHDSVEQGSFYDDFSFSAENIVDMFFAGFLAFAMIFNLLFYYVNRERVYLVYSITLLFGALTSASEVIDYIIFGEMPVFGDFFEYITTVMLAILMIHTIRFFFRVGEYYPRWDKVLVWLPPVFVGLGTVMVIYNNLFSETFTILYALSAVVAIITLLVGIIVMVVAFLRRKHKEAKLFVAAGLPVILSFGMKVFGISNSALLYAAFWAVVLLSWGLFARYKGLQVENARAALETERLAREQEAERNLLIARQNELLEKQVAERTSELQQSLENLKQTQNQLIQSEKMASLGELTAGIAHEIQNPLNFVNNFSDVSVELLQELKEELEKGDIEEATALADDVTQNLEKIAHHGRRADGIVKGMLQHSRASTGQKEPTDINVIADEYFRLAYHGLRAKDKSFNADLVTHFAEGLPKINIISQDVGRVLLNLFTNAFYATQQKVKQAQQAGNVYKPVVEVTTILADDEVVITVKDNGTGIPDAIKDKILQPFFTTKPTGEGTGLGLSLSYDIVVKGHGGSIDILSEEGEFTIFTVKLPV